MGDVRGRQPDALPLGGGAQVRLDVHVLPQDQPGGVVQQHVEVVAGAAVAGVRAVVVPGVLVLGGLHLDHVHHAGPAHLGVHPGVDHHRLAGGEAAEVQLADGALDPELAGGEDAHKGQGLAHGVGAPVFVDLLHGAFHVGVDLGVGQVLLELVDLALLHGAVVLLVLNLQFHRLDLHGVGILLVLAGVVLLVLQVVQLVLQGGDLVGDALQVQLGLVQGQLHLLGVVPEQGRAGADLVAFRHQDLRHGLALVPLDLVGLLGLYHPGVPGGGAGVHAGDGGHGVHVDRRGLGGGQVVFQPEEPQAHRGHSQGRHAAQHNEQDLSLVHFLMSHKPGAPYI